MNPSRKPEAPGLLHYRESRGKPNGQQLAVGLGPARTMKATNRSRKDVTEAVATRQEKATLVRLFLPIAVIRKTHRVVRDEERGLLARTSCWSGRPMAWPVPGGGEICDRGSKPPLRDERNGRWKWIPRSFGRRICRAPRGADVSRTNPVLAGGNPFGRQDIASGDRGAARYSALNPRPSELKRSKSEFFPLTPREGILNSAVCEVHLGVLEDTFLEQSFYHLLVHILSD